MLWHKKDLLFYNQYTHKNFNIIFFYTNDQLLGRLFFKVINNDKRTNTTQNRF
jgi:hypothetical protein